MCIRFMEYSLYTPADGVENKKGVVTTSVLINYSI